MVCPGAMGSRENAADDAWASCLRSWGGEEKPRRARERETSSLPPA